MSLHEITYFFSNEGSRNEVRMRVVNLFANEQPGTGNGEYASKYIYYVESLEDGRRIFLKRPANLHNGFDFVVCVEGMNYAYPGERSRNNPKHTDIARDLLIKKQENPVMYEKLYKMLRRVFECHDVSTLEMNSVSFRNGLPVDHILKVVKWLFIEQDIRYWNYSGRYMTWEIVPPVEVKDEA